MPEADEPLHETPEKGLTSGRESDIINGNKKSAGVVELADTRDLKLCGLFPQAMSGSPYK